MIFKPEREYHTYSWNTGDSTETISLTQGGYYTVNVSNQIGCEVFDNIFVASSLLAGIDMTLDTTLCAGQAINLDASTYWIQKGDSIEIIYDASQGQTGLIGASKVYMHAGAELTPFGGWQIVAGNWGQDDGIGQMDSLGSNLWSITLHPQSYFGYSPNQHLEGIFMVFRNADGTAIGKDTSGNDIYLFTNNGTNIPSSTFMGINTSYVYPPLTNVAYLWNTNATTPSIAVSNAGIYNVEISDGYCTAHTDFQVNEIQPVNAEFNFILMNCHYEFTNLSTNATTYTWNFGDASPLVYTANPIHDYTQNGQYTITLIAQNQCFADTTTMSATCIILGDETENDNLSYVSLYPNPTTGKLKVAITNSEVNEGTIRLYNHLGQVVVTKEISFFAGKANTTLDLQQLAAGVYTLSFENKIIKVVKE